MKSFLRGLIGGLTGRPARDEVSSPPGARPDDRGPHADIDIGPAITLSVRMSEPTPEQEASYALKRDATTLSRSGDMAGAIEALEEAQRVSGEAPQPHDEIRRAKYLQKDGGGAEAWDIYQRLLSASKSGWVDIDLLDAMRLHLQREGRAAEAIHYGIAHRLARIALYRGMRAEAEAAIAGPMPDALAPLGDRELDDLFDSASLWERIKANHRTSIEIADKWLTELTDRDAITKATTTLAKKAGELDRVDALVTSTFAAIEAKTAPRAYLALAVGPS